VWGDGGPTIVRFEESHHPVTLNVRVGSVLPILTTALGKVYAAFSRSPRIGEAVKNERRRSAGVGGTMSKTALDSTLDEVRARGLARIAGDQLPGVSALAAPIFDHLGDVAGVIGALGRQESFDIDWEGPIAIAMRETASEVASRMGFAG
jgi:DNA-binding IclR family transcriptional regulator